MTLCEGEMDVHPIVNRFPKLWFLTKSKSSNYLFCHPWSSMHLVLKFEIHGKTLYYSIFCPFSYTVGVSQFLFAGRINRYAKVEGILHNSYIVHRVFSHFS